MSTGDIPALFTGGEGGGGAMSLLFSQEGRGRVRSSEPPVLTRREGEAEERLAGLTKHTTVFCVSMAEKTIVLITITSSEVSIFAFSPAPSSSTWW